MEARLLLPRGVWKGRKITHHVLQAIAVVIGDTAYARGVWNLKPE